MIHKRVSHEQSLPARPSGGIVNFRSDKSTPCSWLPRSLLFMKEMQNNHLHLSLFDPRCGAKNCRTDQINQRLCCSTNETCAQHFNACPCTSRHSGSMSDTLIGTVAIVHPSTTRFICRVGGILMWAEQRPSASTFVAILREKRQYEVTDLYKNRQCSVGS